VLSCGQTLETWETQDVNIDIIPFARLMVRTLMSTYKLILLFSGEYCSDGCFAGFHQVNGTCKYCPAGKTSNLTGSTSCSDCPGGKFSNFKDLKCFSCPKGTFAAANGSTVCSSCSFGKYAPTQGLSACISCPIGTSTPSEGSIDSQDCSSCALGYIPTDQGCMSCSAGKYWNVSCNLCPPGRFTEQNASTNCDFCPSGKWSLSAGMTSRNGCITCPNVPGVVCPEGSTVPFVKIGWYRGAEGGLDEVLQCSPEEACPESGSFNTTCSSAYRGKACKYCASNYFRLGNRCVLCIPQWSRGLVIVLAVCIFLFICWRLTLAKRRIPVVWKVAFSWIQFLSLYGPLSDNWPASLRALFNVTNVFNFELQYFGFSCDKSVTYWTVWLMKLLFPAVFYCSMIAAYFIRFNISASPMPLIDVFKTKSVGILYMFTLFSTILLINMFEIFNCNSQTDGSFFLSVDPSIVCYSREWNSYLAVNVLFIIIYLVVPLTAGSIYFINLKMNGGKVGVYAQTFAAQYREGCEFWELVRILYKLMFVLIRNTTSLDRGSETLILLGILVLEMYVEVRFRPYRDPEVGYTSAW
jgi:hypothetical protein